MVGEYVLSNAHNSSLAPEFATFFYPSYFAAQNANVAPKVFTTRQVIQTNGLASGSSPFTKARGARVIMPKIFLSVQHGRGTHLVSKGGGDYYTTSF
jgi:hypothetical protein